MARSFPLFSSFLLLLFLSIVSCSDLDPAQQSALISFYDSLTAKGSLAWDTSVSLCDQPGIKCANKKVVQLDLTGMELEGTLPKEIGAFTSLTWLVVEGNHLSGSLPTEIGNLKSLVVLGLQGNLFSGPIPTEIGQLRSLVALALHENNFSGHLPKEIGKLTLLRGLSLHSNQLSGTIPSDIGRLISLPTLNLRGNKFTGTIPTNVARLQALSGIDLSNNQLTGTIPKELGNLPILEELFLANNELTGPIPRELGNLSMLTGLNLRNNLLTGTIPSDLSGAPALGILDLSSNRLTGNVPKEVQRMSFWVLHLANNELCYATNYSSYSGQSDIELVADHCSNCIEPCLNGGTCFSEGMNFGCHCPIGYVGFNCESYLPLHWACTHGTTEGVDTLLTSSSINGGALDSEGRTAAWLCTLNGQAGILKTLMKSRNDLNLQQKVKPKNDEKGITALELAKKLGKDSEAHRLVEAVLRGKDEL